MSGYWMFGSYMGTITSNCDAYYANPGIVVIGDLPYLAWVKGSQPYFEQTTNRREAVFLFACRRSFCSA